MRTIQFWKRMHGKDRQRGAVLLLVTFSLIAFLGFVALALDLGRMYIVKSQLQNAADSGALRAALALNGTRDGVWMAGRPGTDCKNVAAGGDPCGVDGALKNGHLLAASDLLNTEVTVKVANYPYDADDARWQNPGSVTGPNDYYYALVITQKSGIKSFFAGMLGIWENGAQALAIAGRYSPQGQVLPLFIPVIRRNANPDPLTGYNQLNGLVAGYPDCNGVIYDTKTYKQNCPVATDPDWRGPDRTGNWGFLKPGETKSVAGGQFLSSSTNTSSETGGTYIIRLDPNTELDWTVTGTSWTGNFGYFLSEPPIKTQKSLLDATCSGTVVIPNSQIPGCRDLHTGGLSVPSFVEALNTRFDEYPKKDLDPAVCTPDADIQTYDIYSNPAAPPPPSAYSDYCDPALMGGCTPASVGISPLSPSHSGAPGRRVMRVYVIDNAWLRGYTDNYSSSCTDKLQGSSKPGHIIGCAEFFMWKPANKSDPGLFYGEFIRRVPDDLCEKGLGPAAYTEIRLFR